MADEPERIESKVEATSSAVTTDPKESSEEEVNTNPICRAAEMDATPSTNENKETTTDEDVKDEPNEIQGNNQRATTLATAATKATEIVTAHPSTKLSPHSTNIPNQSELTDKNDTLHTISFNQDDGCLAVGTESGFRICNVYPFHEMNRRRLDGDGEFCNDCDMILYVVRGYIYIVCSRIFAWAFVVLNSLLDTGTLSICSKLLGIFVRYCVALPLKSLLSHHIFP